MLKTDAWCVNFLNSVEGSLADSVTVTKCRLLGSRFLLPGDGIDAQLGRGDIIQAQELRERLVAQVVVE